MNQNGLLETILHSHKTLSPRVRSLRHINLLTYETVQETKLVFGSVGRV